MKYGVLFIVLGLGLGASASQGGWKLGLVWPASSLCVVGIGYLRNDPRTFGKRANGDLAAWPIAFHAPFLACLWGVWHLLRATSSGSAFNQLLPDVVIGRRLLPGELPEGIDEVVDLTAEFPEPRRIRQFAEYSSFPILDASVPDLERLIEFVRSLDNTRQSRYFHCAEGHGRTGLVAAALLLWRGNARSPEEAIAHVREARPRARLNRIQRECLAAFHRRVRDTSENRHPVTDA